MSSSPRVLIGIATYKERENLAPLTQEIHQFLPRADILITDDNSPDARHGRLEATRKSTAERIRGTLAADAARQSFDTALQSAARMIPLREKTKLIAVTAINEVRMAMRELGRRGAAAGYFAAPQDVMMLLESELDEYVADTRRKCAQKDEEPDPDTMRAQAPTL